MLNQKPLVEFCKSKDIVVEGYSPFGSPTRPDAAQGDKNVLQDERVLQVAAKHGKSTGQVILRYLVRKINKSRAVGLSLPMCFVLSTTRTHFVRH